MYRPLASLILAATLLAAPVAADEDRLALAQEYASMPEVQSMIDAMFSPASMAAQMEANLPPGITLTESQRDRIGVILSDALDTIRPQMMETMVTASAETFTAPELEALIAFYGSEHGGAVMTKMQPFMQRTMGQLSPAVTATMQSVTPKIVAILQETN